GVYRWRQIMPVALSLEQIGPENPETVGAREIVATRRVRIESNQLHPNGLRILEGRAGDRPVSLLLYADGRMVRGKCTCSHHFTGGLRKGPCRHLQALRQTATAQERPRNLEGWLESMQNLRNG